MTVKIWVSSHTRLVDFNPSRLMNEQERNPCLMTVDGYWRKGTPYNHGHMPPRYPVPAIRYRTVIRSDCVIIANPDYASQVRGDFKFYVRD